MIDDDRRRMRESLASLLSLLPLFLTPRNTTPATQLQHLVQIPLNNLAAWVVVVSGLALSKSVLKEGRSYQKISLLLLPHHTRHAPSHDMC